MKRTLTLALFALLAAGCGDDKGSPGGTPAGEVRKVERIRVSTIPDSDATTLETRFKLVSDWLSKKVGVPIEYTPVKDYAASVTGIATGRIDMVWFGGVTAVQADMKAGGGVLEFIACRDIDRRFKTYYVATKGLGIAPVTSLADLAAKAGGKKLTFGSKSSTSGHVMPRHFFVTQAGKRPEEVFASVGYSGSHDVTLRQVANGDVDLGALNYTNYERADTGLKEKAPIVYTTPEYVDYVWVARKDLGADLIEKIRDAFVSLDPAKPDEKKILDEFKAGRFEAAEKAWWDGIRKVIEAGVDVGA
jgi:phosphonate transport system substrate-binding protein